MLTVADYELIRRKFFLDEMSQRAIAEELGHSRKTVAKAVAHAVPPGYRLKEPRQRPVIEPCRAIIDAWLEEDRSRPRKQRHTAERIYERLREEHGYGGSASSVRRYVASQRTNLGEVFLPLCFAPGEEAQVDWGEATVIENGVERKVQLFCMKFCHSHAVFVRAYERANLESFLDGHVRAFTYFGGVPLEIGMQSGPTPARNLGPPSDLR
jgi:transposase